MRRSILSPLLRRHSPRLTKLTLSPLPSIQPIQHVQPLLHHTTAPYSSKPIKPINPETYLHAARKKLWKHRTVIDDTLSPTPSHLLTLSLADHVPALFPPDQLSQDHPSTEPFNNHRRQIPYLPQGHHLVYFPLQVPPSRLMRDGTDRAHWPGGPFNRRMWAGGEVVFRDGWERVLTLNGRVVMCVEKANEPVMKGAVGDEKVFVEITRDYGTQGGGGKTAVEEVRRLVFMRERERVEGVVEERRVVRAPATPEFTFSLRPDARLLFHFSALTYNAHSIHIDPDYARNREGYKGLLVHGPLTLVLMLSALRACLAKLSGQPPPDTWLNEQPMSYVKSLSYRNLAPLYVDEEMKVCLRRTKTEADQIKWDVWIEGPEGGLAVKASAVTTGLV
ncbi:HotDog domain-containing protein [Chaetomium fimeti]|uniref:HotDog domain-containing protein n=1 Tax=Chaetomium fimeti TaxID=1854472 RepID=A0AAE0HFI3_9PEZI|nr:HotDog domain-containing protein [Chaetomium fimeti]